MLDAECWILAVGPRLLFASLLRRLAVADSTSQMPVSQFPVTRHESPATTVYILISIFYSDFLARRICFSRLMHTAHCKANLGNKYPRTYIQKSGDLYALDRCSCGSVEWG